MLNVTRLQSRATAVSDDQIAPETKLTESQRWNKTWTSRRPFILMVQLLIIAIVLLIWQFAPSYAWVSRNLRFLNRLYISSPTLIVQELGNLMNGTHGSVLVWPYLETTVVATLAGTAIGLVLGVAVGLVLSDSDTLNKILQPFIAVLNSVPRVALIPIFILMAGPTISAEIISVVAVVFFIVFFNAYEGGRGVRAVNLENARVLGASTFKVLMYVRMPSVVEWTLAVVPNALSFALVVSVTTELLAGIQGMGYLLLTATTNIDSTLTFAIIVILGIIGVVLVFLSQYMSNRLIHWRGR